MSGKKSPSVLIFLPPLSGTALLNFLKPHFTLVPLHCIFWLELLYWQTFIQA